MRRFFRTRKTPRSTLPCSAGCSPDDPDYQPRGCGPGGARDHHPSRHGRGLLLHCGRRPEAPAEDAGAGFLGEAGFGSGVFYLYMCVDRELCWLKNLGGPDAAATSSADGLRGAGRGRGDGRPAWQADQLCSAGRADYLLAEPGDPSAAPPRAAPSQTGRRTRTRWASSIAALERFAGNSTPLMVRLPRRLSPYDVRPAAPWPTSSLSATAYASARFLPFAMVAPLAALGDVAVGERARCIGRRARPSRLDRASLGFEREDEAAHAALADGYRPGAPVSRAGRLLPDDHTAQVPSAKDGKRFA